MSQRFSLLIALLISLFIASCGTNTAKQKIDPLSEAMRLEDLAHDSIGEQRSVYQLSAAEAWYQGAEIDRALFTLLGIDSLYLPADQLIDSSLLLADIYQLQGRHQLALEALDVPLAQRRLTDAASYKQAAWAERVGDIYSVLSEYTAAAKYFDLSLSLSDDFVALSRLRKSLWRSLTLAEDFPAHPHASSEMKGWIELAEISNRNAGTLSDQLQQYRAWRIANSDHPADLDPSNSIQILEDIAEKPAPKVALLLPLSGSLATAGNAVLDGYLETLIANKERDPQNPSELFIFDTNTQSISSILREIRELEIQLVIGPLEKSRVEAFTSLVDPTLMALALNSVEQPGGLGVRKSIVGLALDIETEAEQAAVAAMRDGHRTSLVLVPDNESGERASTAFSSAWDSQNGVVAAVDKYGENETHAKLLESRLHVDQSHNRMRSLRRLLARNLEFTPRRRQDIDALFLSASPEQARQIKPMLAYFFAEDIPVYSTSSVYDGSEDAKANRDLDGIKFSTLPWLVSGAHRDPVQGSESRKTGSLLKLQAMGIDAYYLGQRVPQFIGADSTVYHGVLGKLSLKTGENNLDRQQVWAEYEQGIVPPVP